jgi:hypothetical protein
MYIYTSKYVYTYKYVHMMDKKTAGINEFEFEVHDDKEKVSYICIYMYLLSYSHIYRCMYMFICMYIYIYIGQ